MANINFQHFGLLRAKKMIHFKQDMKNFDYNRTVHKGAVIVILLHDVKSQFFFVSGKSM